jgi:hypothetical protein
MDERITVFVNGTRVEVYRAMKVKHALIAFDQQLYAAAVEDRVVVEDSRGFRVGLDGSLHDGAHLRTRESGRV